MVHMEGEKAAKQFGGVSEGRATGGGLFQSAFGRFAFHFLGLQSAKTIVESHAEGVEANRMGAFARPKRLLVGYFSLVKRQIRQIVRMGSRNAAGIVAGLQQFPARREIALALFDRSGFGRRNEGVFRYGQGILRVTA